MPLARWLVIAVIAVAAACGSSTNYGNPPPPPGPPPPPPPPPGGHSTTITVSNFRFSPTPDTIPAGTITFHWASGVTAHNVTWLTGPGDASRELRQQGGRGRGLPSDALGRRLYVSLHDPRRNDRRDSRESVGTR